MAASKEERKAMFLSIIRSTLNDDQKVSDVWSEERLAALAAMLNLTLDD